MFWKFRNIFDITRKKITDNKVTAHKAYDRKKFFLYIKLANIYGLWKILRMLDIFVSLMYCSHLSTKLNLISDGEKKDSEEIWYNQNTTTYTAIFWCWDSKYI